MKGQLIKMTTIDLTISDIKFHDILAEMPIGQLKTEINDDIVNDYDIAILNINKLIGCIHDGYIYKKFVTDDKMIGLVKFIGQGHKLIPPIIRNIKGDSWTIIDGQHRIGLILHIGISVMPFLIRKDQMKFIGKLQ